MDVHGYAENGSIDATIDGQRWNVPDDPTNRHRQMIADWEAQGNTIPPYVPTEPEPVDPLTLPLDRVRFEFLRDKLDRDKPGFIAAAEALFDSLPEDTPAEVDFKLLAKVLWRTGQEFYIHHGLFALAVHEDIITQQELEGAWRAGVALSW